MKHIFILMSLLLIALVGTLPGAAQEEDTSISDLLVTAVAENGVEQVYRINILSGAYEQVTEAEFSVEAYDLSDNVLVYISGDQLHIEHAEGEIVKTLSRPQNLLVRVHISPDEQEVTYNDDTGLYILNINSGEAERLLEQKDFMDPNNPNGVGDGRYYFEAEFLEDGDILKIGVGLWEGQTVGFYDRSTQKLTELITGWTDPDTDLQVFNRFLTLESGQILLHNYDGRGCFPCGLWSAPSIDEIEDYEEIAAIQDLTMDTRTDVIAAGIPAMAQQPDGTIRLFIQYSFVDESETYQSVSFVRDFDPTTGTLTTIMDAFPDDIVLAQPVFSPDGQYLVFVGSPMSDTYSPYGSPVLFDLEDATQIDVEFPLEISSIRWAV